MTTETFEQTTSLMTATNQSSAAAMVHDIASLSLSIRIFVVRLRSRFETPRNFRAGQLDVPRFLQTLALEGRSRQLGRAARAWLQVGQGWQLERCRAAENFPLALYVASIGPPR